MFPEWSATEETMDSEKLQGHQAIFPGKTAFLKITHQLQLLLPLNHFLANVTIW